MEREILLLGDERLYDASEPVQHEQLPALAGTVQDLRDTLFAYRKKYGAGRAIAAPQIGVFSRLIYLEAGPRRIVFFNPVLTPLGPEQMEVLDDCMSFPGLRVKVRRFRRCAVEYRDEQWQLCRQEFEGDFAELVQHEYDHLDGILATMRAIDNRSLVMQRP